MMPTVSRKTRQINQGTTEDVGIIIFKASLEWSALGNSVEPMVSKFLAEQRPVQ